MPYSGRRFRVLTVVDACTRVCLALVAHTSLSGERLGRKLDQIVESHGFPHDDRQRQRHRDDV